MATFRRAMATSILLYSKQDIEQPVLLVPFVNSPTGPYPGHRVEIQPLPRLYMYLNYKKVPAVPTVLTCAFINNFVLRVYIPSIPKIGSRRPSIESAIDFSRGSKCPFSCSHPRLVGWIVVLCGGESMGHTGRYS